MSGRVVRRSILGAFASPMLLLLSACGSATGGADGSPGDGNTGMDAMPLADGADVHRLDTGGDVGPCGSDAECSDSVYCNGTETCSPGAAGADARGCLRGTAPCAVDSGTVCEESTRTCVAANCADPDHDRDGVRKIGCGGNDCDDNDANRYPGNAEVCDANSHDEDCDPCTVYNPSVDGDGDLDHDGFPSSRCRNPWLTTARPAGCNAALVNVVDPLGSAPGYVAGSDCDDDPGPVATDAGVGDGGQSLTGRDIHPGQTESCNRIDDNCNGATDEAVGQLFYPDCDGDLSGDQNNAGFRACTADVAATCSGHAPVMDHTDCNDANAGAHPGASEVCNGVDDDCNGLTDDGLTGVGGACGTGMAGVCSAGTSRCMGVGGIMCVPDVSPSAEVCDGLDNDCNGSVDDGDPGVHSACNTGMTGVCMSGTQHCVNGAMQCMRNTNPGTEVQCNGIDDDCNASTSDTPSGACYTGPSGTRGVGECRDGTAACSGSLVSCSGQVTPSPVEQCNNKDDDCDGTTDNNPSFTCRYPSSRPLTVCGHTCNQQCLNGSCTYECQCTLTSTSFGGWPGDNSLFDPTGVYACANTKDALGTNWRFYSGGAPCYLESGPSNYSAQVPGGNYVAHFWLTGNMNVTCYVDQTFGPPLGQSIPTTITNSSGGYQIVDVLFNVPASSPCTSLTLSVRVNDPAGGTLAVMATYVDRVGAAATVTNGNSSSVTCP